MDKDKNLESRIKGYYSDSFPEAQEKFFHFAGETALSLEETHENEIGSYHRDTGKVSLENVTWDNSTIDVAAYHPKNQKETLVILLSGVHPVEGYFGMGMQNVIFEHLAKKISNTTGLVQISGFDKKNMVNCRKFGEGNVDYNRAAFNNPSSFSPTEEYKEIFDSFKDCLTPKKRIPVLGTPMFYTSLLRNIGKSMSNGHSKKKIVDALASGQYDHQGSVFYGGNLEELRKNPDNLPEPILAYRDYIKQVSKDYEKVLFIDLHSGYGQKGEISLMTHHPERSEEFRKLKSSINRLVSEPSVNNKGKKQALYSTPGSIEAYTDDLLPQKTYGITLDVGTMNGFAKLISEIKVLKLMVEENQVYHNEGSNGKTRRKMKRAFCPPGRWRVNVAHEGAYHLDKLLQDFDLKKPNYAT